MRTFPLYSAAFSTATVSIDKRVWEIFRRTRSVERFVSHCAPLGPTTRLRYLLALGKALRHLGGAAFLQQGSLADIWWATAAARREAQVHEEKRARTASYSDLAALFLRLASRPSFLNVALLCLFSASRFGCLRSRGARLKLKRSCALLALPGSKGQTAGDSLVKCFPLAPWRAFGLKPSLRGVPRYAAVLAAVRPLTLHSFRRSAVTLLARRFRLEAVAALTGHRTATSASTRTIRKYAAHSSRSRLSRQQRAMAEFLWEGVRRKLPEKIPHEALNDDPPQKPRTTSQREALNDDPAQKPRTTSQRKALKETRPRITTKPRGSQ